MRFVKFFVAAAIPFVLLGCPDKAAPDPAMGAKDAAAATPVTAVPGAKPGAAAAPAKSGGW
jgi:hypothetical protein